MPKEFSNEQPDRYANPHEEPEIFIVGNIHEALSRIKGRFVARLQERFGDGGAVETLDFHQYQHSVAVAENSKKFLELIREVDSSLVSESDIMLAEIEGLGHDLVQNSTKEKGKPRQRHRGTTAADIPGELRKKGVTAGNEEASALEILDELRKYRFSDGSPVFPADDEQFRKSIMDDIAVTYPEYSLSELPDGTKALKVFEPYLTERSSLRALALASADLRGSVGAASDSSVFIESGNNEFRELYYDIGQEVAGGVEHIPSDRRAQIAEQILDWEKTQPGFAEWQKILFFESIERNEILNASAKKEEITAKLCGLYKPENFDRSREAARKVWEELEKQFGSSGAKTREERVKTLSLEDLKLLLRKVGYDL